MHPLAQCVANLWPSGLLSQGEWLFLLALLVPTMPAFAGKDTSRITSRTQAQLTFEQHVRPILKAHCFDCHGEGEQLKGDLDLRLRRLIVKGGESGPAIEPGQPEKSHLVELVVKGVMPKRGKKLTVQEIQTIQQWLAAVAQTARDEPLAISK